jgi:hypothetical protein
MFYSNSHIGQIVFSKNTAKGAPNLRGEAITFLHFPPESRSTQKAEPLDQASKEVPRRKMGRFVEVIHLRLNLNSKRGTLNPRRNDPSLIFHKVWKSEHFHQHGEISREAKVFTNDTKPTNDGRFSLKMGFLLIILLHQNKKR